MQHPDHNTINSFRGRRLQDALKNIFTQVVELLEEEGVLSLKDINVDGTKIEDNANRYTFVWGNAINTNKEKLKKRWKDIWQYTKKEAAEQLTGSAIYVFSRKINKAEDADAKIVRVSGKYDASVISSHILMGLGDFSRYNPDFDKVMAE